VAGGEGGKKSSTEDAEGGVAVEEPNEATMLVRAVIVVAVLWVFEVLVEDAPGELGVEEGEPKEAAGEDESRAAERAPARALLLEEAGNIDGEDMGGDVETPQDDGGLTLWAVLRLLLMLPILLLLLLLLLPMEADLVLVDFGVGMDWSSKALERLEFFSSSRTSRGRHSNA